MGRKGIQRQTQDSNQRMCFFSQGEFMLKTVRYIDNNKQKTFENSNEALIKAFDIF